MCTHMHLNTQSTRFCRFGQINVDTLCLHNTTSKHAILRPSGNPGSLKCQHMCDFEKHMDVRMSDKFEETECTCLFKSVEITNTYPRITYPRRGLRG